MIRVAVTAPAFDAVAATLPLGSVGHEAQLDAQGQRTGKPTSTASREHAPIKRFATPEGLANFFVFLCSDCASYPVGSTYFVDGVMLKSV